MTKGPFAKDVSGEFSFVSDERFSRLMWFFLIWSVIKKLMHMYTSFSVYQVFNEFRHVIQSCCIPVWFLLLLRQFYSYFAILTCLFHLVSFRNFLSISAKLIEAIRIRIIIWLSNTQFTLYNEIYLRENCSNYTPAFFQRILYSFRYNEISDLRPFTSENPIILYII